MSRGTGSEPDGKRGVPGPISGGADEPDETDAAMNSEGSDENREAVPGDAAGPVAGVVDDAGPPDRDSTERGVGREPGATTRRRRLHGTFGRTAAVLIVVGVVVVVVIAAAALFARNRRTKGLRSRFGPEYDRAVEARGGRGKAEADLHKLEKRVQKLDIRPLQPAERDRFATSWREVQSNFVDDPASAVNRADTLLGDVMSTRGYPVGDFDQRAADVSVDHPLVVEHYRAAHDIAVRHRLGQATTEDLRQAMIHYRSLFDDLTADAVAPATATEEVARRTA